LACLEPAFTFDHPSHDLVAQDERQLRLGQLAVENVEIGAADRAGGHLDKDLARFGRGLGEVDAPEFLPRCVHHHRAHVVSETG
jgi:hypothetical protein